MSEFIESLTDKELNSLREQALQGGDYEAARGLLEREYRRRTLAIQALHSIDDAYLVPQDPQDELNCSSCQ